MRKITLTLGFTLFCFIAKTQTLYYYYYKGEKQYLELSTERAFLSVKEEQMPDSIKKRNIRTTTLRSDDPSQTRKETSRYYTELRFDEKLSEKQYLNLLSEIKQQNKNAIVSPYFKIGDENVGLSNFFYIKLKEIEDTDLLRQMAELLNCIIIEQYQYMPLWFILSTTEKSELNAMEAANAFYESGLVQSAEPDLMFKYELCSINDPYFKDQWNLRNIGQYGGTPGVDVNAVGAWTLTKGAGVNLGIFDNGVELDHPDIAPNVYLSYDYTKQKSPQDTVYNPHGTACAGVALAVQNNNEGISGVAPESRLVAITGRGFADIIDSAGNYVLGAKLVAEGFHWGWRNGVDVFSCSWKTVAGNYLQGVEFFEASIDSAVSRGRKGLGCLVVFAAGNYNHSFIEYPARLNQVMSVGWLSPCGERKSPTSCDTEKGGGSHYGPELDIMAPGVLLPTTDQQDG